MKIEVRQMPKCPMCGAMLYAGANEANVQCKYCGMQLTISRSDERRQAAQLSYDELLEAFQRQQQSAQRSQEHRLGMHFRLGEEAQNARRYDEAIAYYHKVLETQSQEAEVYWRILMCRYGVEYVPDRMTGKYLPTLTKMQVDDILSDADYIYACQYAKEESIRRFYREQGERIAAIISKYQQILGTQQPYDVFISVKQGDDEGKPTKDRIVALKIYTALREQGFRVFNSQESLTGKAGEEYEPYIMHALSTAKVLVVVASGEEYLNSSWVRNEWRRFCWLKKNEGALSERRMIVYSCSPALMNIPTEIGAVQIIDEVHGIAPMDQLCRAVQEICPPKKGGGKPEQVKKEIPKESTPESDFELVNDGSNEYSIKRYRGKSEHVVIPGEIRGCRITAIAAGAFRVKPLVKSALKSVHIPDSVTYIGPKAFAGCRNLSMMSFGKDETVMEHVVIFPEHMQVIADGALMRTAITECRIFKGTARGDLGKPMQYFSYPENSDAKPPKKWRLQAKTRLAMCRRLLLLGSVLSLLTVGMAPDVGLTAALLYGLMAFIFWLKA